MDAEGNSFRPCRRRRIFVGGFCHLRPNGSEIAAIREIENPKRILQAAANWFWQVTEDESGSRFFWGEARTAQRRSSTKNQSSSALSLSSSLVFPNAQNQPVLFRFVCAVPPGHPATLSLDAIGSLDGSSFTIGGSSRDRIVGFVRAWNRFIRTLPGHASEPARKSSRFRSRACIERAAKPRARNILEACDRERFPRGM